MRREELLRGDGLLGQGDWFSFGYGGRVGEKFGVVVGAIECGLVVRRGRGLAGDDVRDVVAGADYGALLCVVGFLTRKDRFQMSSWMISDFLYFVFLFEGKC